MWHLDGDAKRDKLAKLEAQGWRKIPDSLKPPKVPAGYEEWLLTFFELGTERRGGEVPGPIPASAMERHCDGWPPGAKGLFVRVMRTMDHQYLDWAVTRIREGRNA